MAQKVIAIVGPTAVGKTRYAIEIAKVLNGEIVSCDSMQLYKGMDIGSAKPTPEECAEVPHHLVGEIDPKEPFSAARYQKMAKSYISDIASRGKMPIIEGGTGLYLHALLYNLDFAGAPGNESRRKELERAASEKGTEALVEILKAEDPDVLPHIDPHNPRRLIRAIEAAESGTHIADFSSGEIPKNTDYDFLLVGLKRDREELYGRIDRRVDQMMKEGLEQEVRGLLDQGLTADDISMKGIGYKEMLGYLEGEYSLNEAVRRIKTNTRHLAKKQMTWFRRYEDVEWFNASLYESDAVCADAVIKWLEIMLWSEQSEARRDARKKGEARP